MSETKRLHRRMGFLLAGLWLLAHAAAALLETPRALVVMVAWDGVLAFAAGLWWLSGKVFRR